MFFTPKTIIRLLVTSTILLGSVVTAVAQSHPRQQALQQAQRRADRVAQGSSTRNETGAPVVNSFPMQSAPVVGGPSSSVTGGYVPQHLSGSPAVGTPMVQGSSIVNGGSPIIYDDYQGGSMPYASDYGVDSVEGCGCGEGDCGGCGIGGSYFNNCANRIGGCGPCAIDQCWVGALGRVISNGELFAGAHAFRSRSFTAGNQLVDDSSFGFYGGTNLGLSLCRLTCGLFSGQVGVRSTQSEFDGDFFSGDNRDQLFVTAGVFRRVDYGLQIGVAGDFLRENWFTETDLSQVRGDIGWVYAGGNTLGFRFATGTEDDTTSGIINGIAFDNLFAEVIDNYRFYYRFNSFSGGFCDAFAGWSDESHAILGLDYDMPLNGVWGMQAGFTYFLPDQVNDTANIAAPTTDAWNLYIGFSLRPQGLNWYGNYDRPLFNVADNGTFVFGRN